MKDRTIIFTDGASRGNPGPGGFGAIIIGSGKVLEIGGRESQTTNNRMELMAVIRSLEQVDPKLPTTIYTDSKYVFLGVTKWLSAWQNNNWKTKAKQPVLNSDLWQSLLPILENRKIEWKRISGHAGLSGNERADEIATTFADGEPANLYSGPMEKYPLKESILKPVSAEDVANKKEKKNRSRAKAYSYVSKVDGLIEVHKTWTETAERVKGRSNARFKKSISPEDEKNIIEEFSG